MISEGFNYLKQKTSKFIAGSSKSRFGFSSFTMPRVTSISRIIPKRAFPQQIFQKTNSEPEDNSISSSRKDVSVIGRVVLDLVNITDNLDKIREVIEQDYKNSKEQNKKEVEEYRKRIANRGRIVGKKELGDKKEDLTGIVKKYAGSFFSGVGGGIRSLAALNLFNAILEQDFGKALSALLGIGVTYLPAIGAGIGAGIAKGLTKKLFGSRNIQSASKSPMSPRGIGSMSRLKKFAAPAALIGGGLALGSGIFGGGSDEDDQQQRLRSLTEEQKGLTDPSNLVPIPQDDLKRFEKLNKKFEEALDFLIKRQKDEDQKISISSSGGGGPSPTPTTPTPQNVVPTGSSVDVGGGISYYGPGFAGRRTASGTVFNPEEMTAAHRTLPFGTLLRVTNNDTGKSVVVKVTDRGPFVDNRSLDLSEGAMRSIGGISSGVLKNATIEVVKSSERANQQNVTPSTVSPRSTPPRQLPPPRQKPSPVLPPTVTPTSSRPTSTSTVTENDVVPSFETSYSDNIFTLYSKLTYQIV
jgi:rare lipoprotein A (peptidoglycan hydrolase)